MHATLIRSSTEADLPAITALYDWNAVHGTGTFELAGPPLEEMAQRRADVLAKGLPWLVAERDGRVLGYAYANLFRARMAWRHTLEDSIYLAPQAQNQGLGRLLLAELIARCTALGARQMLAVIGDSGNAGSINLHRRCGYTEVGVMKSVGWKFDRWVDCVIMQRSLGEGDHLAAVVAAYPGGTGA